ncbi:MAG TPA: hypothetical protein VMX13_14615 [Sedimentisphaerales bacterium]|nr:hypothetical protein [Sedimentisphaerales bacterium]
MAGTNMKHLAKLTIVCAFYTVFANSVCNAWLRMHVEDAVLVARSEHIVVGHLEADSVKYVPHERENNRGRSWEHHATLAITEVLKGNLDEKEIPIVIHYGLDPYIGGRCPKDGGKIDIHAGQEDFPKDRIEILDTGNSGFSPVPLVEDAGKDNIWFLHRTGENYDHKSQNGLFGIADPEDLQPLSMKTYFLACLADEPEKAVKEQLKKEPHLAERVGDYLLYWEFQQVLSIADPNEKAINLSRYLSPTTAPGNYRRRYDYFVRKHLRDLGESAVKPLVDLLAKSEPGYNLNTAVLTVYDIGRPAKAAAPYLVRMLKQKSRTSTYYILAALQTTRDPNAIDFVRPFLADGDMQVRAQAAVTLAWLEDMDSFDRIVAAVPEHISDQNASYVKDMCCALYRLDPARARPIIKNLNTRVPSMDITQFISGYKDNDDQ